MQKSARGFSHSLDFSPFGIWGLRKEKVRKRDYPVMPEPGGGDRGATAPSPIFGRLVNPIPTGESRLSPPITTPSPIFGILVNPIPTGEGRLSPPITTGTPNVFHLPASLRVSTTITYGFKIPEFCMQPNLLWLLHFILDYFIF